MATKSEPGPNDCYERAESDEPMFVLLGRDRMAPALVRLWVSLRREHGEREEVCAEAEQCAEAMEAWLRKLGKEPIAIPDVTVPE